MKKLKISELPLFNNLKGLFTIGTDSQNRSVKVSLEFIEEETTAAVRRADAATADAVTAKDETIAATVRANAATADAIAAKNACDASKTAADLSKQACDSSKAAADSAASGALTAKGQAEQATQAAYSAKGAADGATFNAEQATLRANIAAQNADTVKADITSMLQHIVPTGLTVECLKRITYGNVAPIFIKALLTPEDAIPNIIFISDNKAVSVSTDGQIWVVGKGQSKVSVIPTCNTKLAKTVVIEVGDPTLRLHTRNALRLTSSGAFMLN